MNNTFLETVDTRVVFNIIRMDKIENGQESFIKGIRLLVIENKYLLCNILNFDLQTMT